MHHHQSLDPLPNLDHYLELIQTNADTTSSQASSQTRQLQIVREQAPIFASLEQISREVQNLYRAIAQF